MALPSPGPKNLTIKRDSANNGNSITASWGNPANALAESGHMWNGVDETWRFNASKDMSSKVVQQRGSGHSTGDVVWVRDKGIHDSSTVYYNRSKYHPLTAKRYLETVVADIWPYNGSGETHAKVTYTFKAPRAPKVSVPEYDPSTHALTFSVETDEGSDARERYDTMYRIVRQDSSGMGEAYRKAKAVKDWTSTTDTEKDVTYSGLGSAPALAAGEWVKITCEAYARGLAGDSDKASRTFVYAWPARASITKITASSLWATGYVTVKLKTNSKDTAPVDSVKLQRLRSSTASTPGAAGLEQGWEDVDGAVDNGNCAGFTDLVDDALPAVRTHTWYRLVTTHGAYTRNSAAVEAECLYRAKAPQENDKVKFLSIEPGATGDSVACKLAWNDQDSNTTQISWADHEDAWESTEQPSTCDVTWEDAEPASGYQHSANVTVRGLEEGRDYYVRARRGLVSGSTASWGGWCYPDKECYPISTALAPTDVVLAVPSVVERGSGIDCSWTFSGSEQTAWEVAYLDGETRKVLVAGDGPAGAATVPAEMVEGMDSVSLAVSVTTGGEWASSAYVPVTIDDAPDLSLDVAAVVTAQPIEIGLESSTPDAYVTLYVTSGGVTTDAPDGQAVQAEGDVVWAETLAPAWETDDVSVDEDTVWTATVVPPVMRLYDGASYSVTAVATDARTLLSSDWAEASFDVAWSHKAVVPKDTTPIEVDGLTATITPIAPDDGYGTGDSAAATDVVDVYRSTPDGNYLIASDVPFGQPVTDRFAPFSNVAELAYVLCTRTADGDVDWGAFPYVLRHSALRVDFGEESVELPYNVTVSDAWEKSFELREHLDGTRAGYWNEGATRKATLSTDVIKVEGAGQRRLLAALAQHAGPCFVRTPDGCAYPANVEVTDYGVSYSSGAVPVSISATEVAMTDAFRIAAGDWGDAS